MDKCRDSNSRDRFVKGFTRWGVRFWPPTLPTLSPKWEFLDFEVELPLVMFVPFVWDMEDMYGASKGSYRFSGAINTIELDDFIREFNIWCDM